MKELNSKKEEEKLVAISDGVLEGSLVEGVRYFSPKHMSGWWITNESFNGDIKNIKTVHLKHVIESRPDLIKFLSLPYGSRFYQEGYKGFKEDVWIDENIKNENLNDD